MSTANLLDTAAILSRPPLAANGWVTYFVLISSYVFGAIMIGHEVYPGFEYLTPAHLLLTAGLLLRNHSADVEQRTRGRAAPLLLWAVICGLAGWWAEYVGVHYGYLFGDYAYGPTLGPAAAEIPLVMAINWIVVIYATCTTVEWLASALPVLAKAVLAAILLVGLDYLIEPVAMTLDFWQWQGGGPPLHNFIGWFGVGLIQALLFFTVLPRTRNPLAPLVFALQVCFFAYLLVFYS